ncbi:MAG: GatB/YqeY domain-containing protein [Alphaproteobacteria bacterium]
MRTQLNEALKTAMRARDACAVSTLRLILAAVKDRDIAARGAGRSEGLDDDEILDLLQKMIRQRQESITLYEQGGRLDLVERESREIEIIRDFLPKQLDDGELCAAVRGVVGDLGAVGLKDMGRVMAELRSRYAGQIDLGKASALARRQLV